MPMRPPLDTWRSRPVDLPRHPPFRPAMDRRRFLLTSLAGALGAPLAAEAAAGRQANLDRMAFFCDARARP